MVGADLQGEAQQEQGFMKPVLLFVQRRQLAQGWQVGRVQRQCTAIGRFCAGHIMRLLLHPGLIKQKTCIAWAQ